MEPKKRRKRRKKSQIFLAHKEQIPWTRPKFVSLLDRQENKDQVLDDDHPDALSYARPPKFTVTIDHCSSHDGSDPRLRKESPCLSRAGNFTLGFGPPRRTPLVYIDPEVDCNNLDNGPDPQLTMARGELVTEKNFYSSFMRRSTNFGGQSETFGKSDTDEYNKNTEWRSQSSDLRAHYLATLKKTDSSVNLEHNNTVGQKPSQSATFLPFFSDGKKNGQSTPSFCNESKQFLQRSCDDDDLEFLVVVSDPLLKQGNNLNGRESKWERGSKRSRDFDDEDYLSHKRGRKDEDESKRRVKGKSKKRDKEKSKKKKSKKDKKRIQTDKEEKNLSDRDPDLDHYGSRKKTKKKKRHRH